MLLLLLYLNNTIIFAVGAPIKVEKVASPTQEQIDSLHSKYMEELQKLFDNHKDKFAHPDAVLKII